jgi:hypothetical protein
LGKNFKIKSHPPGGFYSAHSRAKTARERGPWSKHMTRQEMMAAIKECAVKLGHAPSQIELAKMAKITPRAHAKAFWQTQLGPARVRPGKDQQPEAGAG